MALKQTQYIRDGKVIRKLPTDQFPDGSAREYRSVNEAKRESRKIQLAESPHLGNGILRVVQS